MHINKCELRAEVVWQQVLGAAMLSARSGSEPVASQARDLFDSSVTAAALHNGNSSSYELQSEWRRRVDVEGTLDMRLCSTCYDTYHQPADGGTRPDEHGV